MDALGLVPRRVGCNARACRKDCYCRLAYDPRAQLLVSDRNLRLKLRHVRGTTCPLGVQFSGRCFASGNADGPLCRTCKCPRWRCSIATVFTVRHVFTSRRKSWALARTSERRSPCVMPGSGLRPPEWVPHRCADRTGALSGTRRSLVLGYQNLVPSDYPIQVAGRHEGRRRRDPRRYPRTHRGFDLSYWWRRRPAGGRALSWRIRRRLARSRKTRKSIRPSQCLCRIAAPLRSQ